MSFQTSDWDADVPNFSAVSVLSKKRRKKGSSKITEGLLNGTPNSEKPSKGVLKNVKKFKNKIKNGSKNKNVNTKSEQDVKTRKHFKQKLSKNDTSYSVQNSNKGPINNNKHQQKIPTRDKKQFTKGPASADNEFQKKFHNSEKFSNILKIQSKKQKAQNSVIKSKAIKKQDQRENSRFPNLFFEKPTTKENKKYLKVKSLRERMLERLKGARFRYINEQLYLSDGKDAKTYFESDPESYHAYHEGYRQQVNKWPINPVNVIIDQISKLPKDKVIADFGCGDAKLAKSVPHKVKSFDLVSNDPQVIESNMAHTPLLASEIDVAVYCLSLMGTNLNDYIREANRVLKVGGTLKIAEVESRFDDIDKFITDVSKFGFKLLNKNLSCDVFYFLDFKKEREVGKKGKKNLPTIHLKACLYKKR